jgi:hypothetical protein
VLGPAPLDTLLALAAAALELCAALEPVPGSAAASSPTRPSAVMTAATAAATCLRFSARILASPVAVLCFSGLLPVSVRSIVYHREMNKPTGAARQ